MSRRVNGISAFAGTARATFESGLVVGEVHAVLYRSPIFDSDGAWQGAYEPWWGCIECPSILPKKVLNRISQGATLVVSNDNRPPFVLPAGGLAMRIAYHDDAEQNRKCLVKAVS